MAASAIQRIFLGRARIIAFGVVVVAALYLLAVAPVRTYFGQREAMAEAQQRYDVLAKANSDLQARANQLQSDAEIQRLARERYELVPEGKQVFAVMPSGVTANPSISNPPAPPRPSVWQRALDDVTFWN